MSRGTKVKFILLILAVILLLLGARYFELQERLREILAWVELQEFWTPFFFVIIMALVCILFGPVWLVTMSAGIIFGMFFGVVYAWAGSVIGAMASYYMGRYWMRDRLARQIERDKRLLAIDRAVEKGGWKVAFMVRLMPFVPFTAINYALSITRIPTRIYFTTLTLGIIPGVVINVFVGWMLGDLARLDREHVERPAWEWALYGAGFALVLAASYFIYLKAREIIKAESEEAEI
jgi:uncharacterized membrane protein YdjX (TVP38/TMEM64 family)